MEIPFCFAPHFDYTSSTFFDEFFYTVMSGNASPIDLAGVAIGTSLWVPIQAGLTGILLAVTPMVAQMVGAMRKEQVPFIVLQALYLAVAIAIIIIFCGTVVLDPILHIMKLETDVRDIARNFLIALSFGIVVYLHDDSLLY